MASFNKFLTTVQSIAQGDMNLNADTLKIALTNTAPTNTFANFSSITDLSTGGGYTAGGTAIGSTSATETGGVLSLIGNAVVFTATTGFGPFRYAVIYDSTVSTNNLIGWWDYGSSVTLAASETFTVNSAANGNWNVSNPILTIT